MPAAAGFVEIGASANYRSTGYNADNLNESITYTGSISYYFAEMCAFEMAYTTGYSRQVTKGSQYGDPKETVEDNIDLLSGDIVLSPAGRQDPFRPYVKLGAGYLKKDRYRRVDNNAETLLSRQEGLVPSGGLGLSINLTKMLSIKFGLEAWPSPLKVKPVIIDYAGRAGVAWIF